MKLILEAIKALFREIKASRTHYDERRTVHTPPVTVAGNTVCWGFVKVADEVDFDINSITHVTRRGSDGVVVSDARVTFDKLGRDVVGILVGGLPLGMHLPTQAAADSFWANSESENPFTPGLYMRVDCFSDENPGGIGAPVEVTYSFALTTGELKKLDEKYLPDKVVEAGAKICKVEKLAGEASRKADDAMNSAKQATAKAANVQTTAEAAMTEANSAYSQANIRAKLTIRKWGISVSDAVNLQVGERCRITAPKRNEALWDAGSVVLIDLNYLISSTSRTRTAQLIAKSYYKASGFFVMDSDTFTEGNRMFFVEVESDNSGVTIDLVRFA